MSEAERERIYQTAITQMQAEQKPKLPTPMPVTCNLRPSEVAILSRIRASAWSY